MPQCTLPQVSYSNSKSNGKEKGKVLEKLGFKGKHIQGVESSSGCMRYKATHAERRIQSCVAKGKA